MRGGRRGGRGPGAFRDILEHVHCSRHTTTAHSAHAHPPVCVSPSKPCTVVTRQSKSAPASVERGLRAGGEPAGRRSAASALAGVTAVPSALCALIAMPDELDPSSEAPAGTSSHRPAIAPAASSSSSSSAVDCMAGSLPWACFPGFGRAAEAAAWRPGSEQVSWTLASLRCAARRSSVAGARVLLLLRRASAARICSSCRATRDSISWSCSRGMASNALVRPSPPLAKA